MRGISILFVFVSVIFFPWMFTVVIAIISSFFLPLLPIAAGIFADTLYYTTGVPIFSLGGAFVTVAAFIVRSRLSASIMRR